MSANQRIVTEQESFWTGEFGNEYTARNQGKVAQAASIGVLASILPHCAGIESALELGTNLGLNMQSLALLKPELSLHGVEINAKAVASLRQALPQVTLHHVAIQDFVPPRQYDLVFTMGVLIHLAPETLPDVYRLMAACAVRYVLVSEYYSPTPVEVPYRGHSRRMFKRDFAGEFLNLNPGWQLRSYGCTYRRDPAFAHNDANWFLMERKPHVVL
jgi:pseudaminic acid biosynthesis-associated methylase